MHAQRMVTSKNVLIPQILAEIFGRIGGWHVVGLGFCTCTYAARELTCQNNKKNLATGKGVIIRRNDDVDQKVEI